MGLKIDQLDYDFDPALVAVEPAEPRDAARLLEVRLPPLGSNADDLELVDRRVSELPDLLRAGDRLVLNRTRVVPARIHALREDTKGRVEGLLAEVVEPGCWWAMLRPARRLRPGGVLVVLDREGRPSSLRLHLEATDEEGRLRVRLVDPEAPSEDPRMLESRLHREAGHVPLPPYIIKARRDRGMVEEEPEDRVRYQTTFAGDHDRTASVAAPTAGLHFTPALLERAVQGGCEVIPVSLEVGAGTFKPVETEDVSDHRMHVERCVVEPESRRLLDRVEADRRDGTGRLVAVGTTSVRTLESMPSHGEDAPDRPIAWETDLLIQPGHRFRRVDALLTNFHQPRSTLLALVAAMTGIDRLHRIYEEAVRRRYRLFSYGDAMFIHRPGDSPAR